MSRLRVMVVDDEPLAREGLVELLETLPDVEIAGVHPDGVAALRAIEREAPDVLCVDIRMPGLDGFDLVAALDRDAAPAVIFVTAYDEFAVRAFEANAVDYLLKPVMIERLTQALGRARDRLRAEVTAAPERLAGLLEELATSRQAHAGRLLVREVGRVLVVPTSEVDWIEGADYYARLHVGERTYLIREPLTSLERRLDQRRFLRVHRSSIVNLSRVRMVETAERGDGVVVLSTGARVRVTAARRAELEQRLGELEAE